MDYLDRESNRWVVIALISMVLGLATVFYMRQSTGPTIQTLMLVAAAITVPAFFIMGSLLVKNMLNGKFKK